MEIDNSTIIIGSIFTIAMFGPIAYLVWKGLNRTQRIRKIIQQVEKETTSKFSDNEVWNDRAIGIDPETKRLVFVDMLKQTPPWKLIDLNKATNCQVINTGEIIQLLIGTNDPESHTLTLFDTQTDDPQSRGFHSLLAKKWFQLIEKNLYKKKKSTLRAA